MPKRTFFALLFGRNAENVYICTRELNKLQFKHTMRTVYDFTVKDRKGKDVSLKEYANEVLLIVNTATKCGFTPQYDELEKLYEKYHAQGFEILDFPCNQFGRFHNTSRSYVGSIGDDELMFVAYRAAADVDVNVATTLLVHTGRGIVGGRSAKFIHIVCLHYTIVIIVISIIQTIAHRAQTTTAIDAAQHRSALDVEVDTAAHVS